MVLFRLFSLFVLFSAIGCQTAEKTQGPTIFGNLYVRYLQDGGQVKAEASFFEGDSAHTAQPVSVPGGVSFQGSGMESRNIQDKLIRYQYENSIAYSGEFTFQVQDEAGKVHRFAASMPPVDSFYLPETISKSKGTTLELQPAPASQNEELAILFTDAAGKASLLEIKPPISKKVALTPTHLGKLSPGAYQIYLVKKQRTFIEREGYKVYFDLEFYTGVKEVVVGDQ